MLSKRCFPRFAVFAAALLLLLAFAGGTLAESYDATTMRLLSYEGTVEIFDPDGQPRFVRENARFASGEAMQTGEDGTAAVSLDATKIVTLDKLSRVEFVKEGSHIQLTLKEGAIFLDVQEKLDENESFDIQTSTMTAGIRGTIVFMQALPEGAGTRLGVLEGVTQISYTDPSGARRMLDVPAGRKLDMPSEESPDGGLVPIISPLIREDVEGFVAEQVLQNDILTQRVLDGSDAGPALLGAEGSVEASGSEEADEDFSAGGDWVWSEPVTLVAQSASKLYDGQALTRPSDVLVQGLPSGFSIRVAANGSQANAGSSENPIAHCSIFNAAGEDVTGHFTDIRKVSGTLRVDPIPVTVWTGSAKKYYDGTPLTCEEAELKTAPGYVYGEPEWRNTSVVTRTALGSETMVSVVGITLVHGSNPITGQTEEIPLYTGQRLSVRIHNEGQGDSIEFKVETLKPEELPSEILRVYADNPDILAQACADAGWDPEVLAALIAELPDSEAETVTRHGVRIAGEATDDVMQDSTNVRITIDTEITNYNSRPLNGQEAHFTPIELEPTITIDATGSQTEVGESPNTYEITWGNALESNYRVVGEELGTLTVLEPILDRITLTAASDEKVYDGTPLKAGSFSKTGLPAGFTVNATVEGSQTDAGEGENRITSWQILDAEGRDVTAAFPNVRAVSGTLTVTPAPLTVTTGSAEKVYDGTALTAEEATLTGLVPDETASIAATGSLTRAGTADNTYEITWGSALESNYTVASETLGTLTVEALALSLDCGGTDVTYSGSVFVPAPVLTYQNGPHAGETVSGVQTGRLVHRHLAGPDDVPLRDDLGRVTFRFSLFTGDVLEAAVSGLGTGAGTYTLTGSVSVPSGSDADFDVSYTGVILTVSPALLTVATASGNKVYDGTALTADSATVTGLISADEGKVTVAATGTITDAGTASNTCAIDWGTVSSANYTVIEQLGTLTVEPLPVTIEMESGWYPYYGEYQCTAAHVSSPNTNFELIREPQSTTDPHVYWHVDWGWGDSLAFVFDGCRDVGTYTLSHSAVTGVGSTKVDNYSITWTSDTATFTVRKLGINIYSQADRMSRDLSAAPMTPTQNDLRAQYQNGIHGAEYITPDSFSYADGVITEHFTLFTGDEIVITSGGWAENGVGPHTVTTSGSVASGNADNFSFNYYGNSSYTISFTGTITVTADSASKPYDGTALTADGVTAEGLPAGYTCTGTASGSQTAVGGSENTVTAYTILDADGKDVTALFPTVTTEKGTLTVTSNDTAITVTSADAEGVYSPFGLRNANYTVEGLPAGLTLTAEVTGEQTVGGSSPNTIASYTITDGDGADVKAYFTNVTLVEGTLTLAKDKINLWSVSQTFTYDGNWHSATVYYQGARASENPGTQISTYNYATVRNVGSYDATYDVGAIRWDLRDKYEVGDVAVGTITIEPVQLSFTAADATVYRTGDYVVPEVTLTYVNGSREGETVAPSSVTSVDGVAALTYNLLDSDTVTLTLQGLGQEAGTYTVTGTLTFDSETTANNYTVTAPSCTVTIQTLTATVTTGSAEKVYDGTALTAAAASITGLAAEDEGKVTITAAGSLTDVDSVDNTYTIDWGTVNGAKYQITEELGTLTVKPLQLQVDLGGKTETYQGATFSVPGVLVTYLNGDLAGETETPGTTVSSGSGVEFGVGLSKLGNGEEATVRVQPTAELKDAGTYTLTANTSFSHTPGENYTVSYLHEAFTIEPAVLTVTTDSAAKVYDGTPLTAAGTSYTGLKGTDAVTVTADGSLTDANEADNTYTIGWGSVNPDNYTVAEELGTLTVEPLQLNFNIQDVTMAYANRASDAPFAKVTLTIGNGPHAGETVSHWYNSHLVNTKTEKLVAQDEYYMLFTGDRLYIDIWGMDRPVGTYELKMSGPYAASGYSIKKTNYSLTCNTATWTVTPRSLTVTTATDSKAYDGTPLTNTGVTLTGVDSMDEGKITATATGTITDMGTTDNTYTMDWGTVDSNNYALTEVIGTLTVTPNVTAITLTADSADKVYDGTALTAGSVEVEGLPDGFTCTATASGSRTDAGSSANQVTAWTIQNANGDDVTAAFSGVTTVDGTLTVSKKPVTVSVGGGTFTYDGTTRAAVVTCADSACTVLEMPDHEWRLEWTSGDLISFYATGTRTDAGSSDIEIHTLTGAKNFDITFTDTALTISPATLTVTTESASKAYDGTPLTAPGTVAGLADGETVTLTTASVTEVSSVTNGYTITWGSTEPGNYTVSENLGTLTVTPNMDAVTITADSAEKPYDGTPLTAAGCKTEGLPDGFTCTAVASGSQTNAGTGDNTVASYVIRDAGENDVTAYFANVTTVKGTLTVTKAAAIIRTGGASKTFDGAPVTCTDAPISGFIETDISVTPTGSRTDAGSSSNTYTVDWGSADPDNYEITEELGSLEVTPLEVSFSLYCYDKDFDGFPALPETIEGTYAGGGTVEKDSEIFGEDAYGSFTDLTAEFSLTGGGKVRLYTAGAVNAGDYTLVPTQTMLAGSAGNYSFTFTDNTGTISPLEAQFSLGGGYDVCYDGQFHGANLQVYCDNELYFVPYKTGETEWTVTCENGDRIVATITGGGTAIGSYTLTPSLTFASGSQANYDISYWGETLDIVSWDIPITFTAGSGSKPYDGTPLTVNTVELTSGSLPYGWTWTATGAGSQTDAGSSGNDAVIRFFNGDGTDVTAAAGTAFTNLTAVPGTLTVTAATATVSTGSASKPYDGTALTEGTASISGLAAADEGKVTVTATGSVINAGSAENTYSINWGTVKSGNYTLTEELGTLEVTAKPVSFTVSGNRTYNGQVQLGDLVVSGVSSAVTTEVSAGRWQVELPGGAEFQVNVSGGGTDVGTYPCYLEIGTQNGLADNYAPILTDGSVTIGAAALTVETGSAGKTFDGTPLMDPTVNVTGLTAADAAIVEVIVTGTVTDVDEVPNTCEIAWGTVNSANYTLNKILGTLKVTPLHLSVNLKGQTIEYGTLTDLANPTMTYADGDHQGQDVPGTQTDPTSHGDMTFSLATGDTIRVAVIPPASAAGTYTLDANVTCSGSLSNYDIGYTNRSFTVSKRKVGITTMTESKAYDGEPLPSTTDGPTVTGSFVEEDVYVYTDGVSITDVDSVTLGYSISWGSADPDNYEIEEHLGTLTISQLGLSVSLGGKNMSYGHATRELEPKITFANGPSTGETVGADIVTPTENGYTAIFSLYTWDTLTLTVTGFDSLDAGTYTLSGSCSFSGKASNYSVSYTDTGITVSKVGIRIATVSESKVYDGNPLPETTDRPIVTGTFPDEGVWVGHDSTTITDYGHVTRGYTIDWNGADPDNYVITEELGTLNIDKLETEVFLGGFTAYYDEEGTIHYQTGPMTPYLTYRNGPREGQTLSPASAGDGVVTFNLYTDAILTVTYGGYDGETEQGRYNLSGSSAFSGDSAANYKVTYAGAVIINAAP